MLNFNTTPQEQLLINRIVDRAEDEMALKTQSGYEHINLVMDITACHCSGCKLDLEKLLKSPTFSLGHDINGISKNINRDSGEIENCFLPRAAK